MGDYYGIVQNDHAQALEEYVQGQQLAPKDARLLMGVASSEQNLGRAQMALIHLKQAEVLDPKSVGAGRSVLPLLALRRYPEALAAANRALALAPENLFVIHAKAMVYLAQGDLEGARDVLHDSSRHVDRTALITYMAV